MISHPADMKTVSSHVRLILLVLAFWRVTPEINCITGTMIIITISNYTELYLNYGTYSHRDAIASH